MAGSHGGSPKSWLAVIVILLGFTVGGVALCLGPNWMLVWVGVGIIVVGGVIALLVDIFSDVIVDAPREPLDRAS
ncbi:HGxxPAAW family protein [Streptosporangium sp. NPDC087985]|uniref:HGxxPAAW family protein n=1 Tax=Streptosporangium sp. NPDC087985 TaxID=3366196 RepID=UPI0037FDAB4D